MDGKNERTGLSTKRLPGIVFQVDVEKEFPILKSKFVAAKTCQREIEWIWKKPSNNIKDLKAHIWDSWSDENGSIGKSYGYQAAKPISIYLDVVHKTPESFRQYDNQIQFVLDYLTEVPNGRWGVITLWNIAELHEMNLIPCCHTSTWNLDGGRLNCILDQRSGDMPYGVPFNTTQYAILMIMMARHLGVKPGLLTHVIADAHIYENQMHGVELQLLYANLMHGYNMYSPEFNAVSNIYTTKIVELEKTYQGKTQSEPDEIMKRMYQAIDCKPIFKINTDSTDFFSYTADDCCVEDYHHMGKIDFGDVAV